MENNEHEKDNTHLIFEVDHITQDIFLTSDAVIIPDEGQISSPGDMTCVDSGVGEGTGNRPSLPNASLIPDEGPIFEGKRIGNWSYRIEKVFPKFSIGR